MGFQTTTVVNYDPHHIISIKRQVNKNNPFEHQEVEGLSKKANWSDYYFLMKNEEDMQQDPISPVTDVRVTQQDLLAIIPTVEGNYPHFQSFRND